MGFSVSSLAALTFVGALLLAQPALSLNCKLAFQRVRRTVLMVADPGTFSGSAELKYYLSNLKGAVEYDTNYTVCGKIVSGTLLLQPVLLVSTGIGPTTAGLCVQELLQCDALIKEIVYSGTSGNSVQKGGVLNADGLGPNPSTILNHLGDICISPLAVNWVCQQSDWTQQANGFPNVDVYPGYTFGPDASFLYGECFFTKATNGSFALADELHAVGKSLAFANGAPRPNTALLESTNNYTMLMEAGTGVPYKKLAPSDHPVVWKYDVCSEVDGQFFFSGVPWDMSARNFTAELINLKFGSKLTQKDVVIANAMEGVGVAQAIERHNSLATTKKPVSYTNVRGFSDYLHDPVKPVDGGWRQVPFPRDFVIGYSYAIASYSYLVLSWLQGKCLAAGNGAAACAFMVDYV